MRVEIQGFAPYFTAHHAAQIRSAARRPGRITLDVKSLSTTLEGVSAPYYLIARHAVTIAVVDWHNAQGDNWLVAQPAADEDIKIAEAYDAAYLKAKMDPRTGYEVFLADEARRRAEVGA